MTTIVSGTSADVKLQPGERILWQGRPNASFIWWPAGIVLAAVVVPLLVVLVVLAAVAQPRNAPPTVPIIVLLPFAIVLAVLIPLWAYLWRQFAGTEYVLTDRRAIIRNPQHEAQIDLAQLAYVEIRRGLAGRSTIAFAPPVAYGRYAWYSGAAFNAIDDGDRVYGLINDARARLRPS